MSSVLIARLLLVNDRHKQICIDRVGRSVGLYDIFSNVYICIHVYVSKLTVIESERYNGNIHQFFSTSRHHHKF